MGPDKICAALCRLAAKAAPGGGDPSAPAISAGDRRAVAEAAKLIERAYGPFTSGAREGLRLLMSIDGAARGNPGPAGIGVMLEAENRLLQRAFRKYIGEATNNVAEYEALLFALREARKLQPAVVKIRSDSELLVRQVQGRYRVKNPRLAALHAQARDLINQLSAISCQLSIEHVGRELNRQADALANRAIDEALSGVPREGGRS